MEPVTILLEQDHAYSLVSDTQQQGPRLVAWAKVDAGAQNQASKGGTSRYRGVSWRSDTGRWAAYVMCNYRRHTVGCFATEAEAVAAAQAARRRLMPYDEPVRHAS